MNFMKDFKDRDKAVEIQKSLAKVIYKNSSNTQELVHHTAMFAASILGTLLCIDESFNDDLAKHTTEKFLAAISKQAFGVYYHQKELALASEDEQSKPKEQQYGNDERSLETGTGEREALDTLFGGDTESSREGEERDS